jgi:hypothetical protein
MAKPSSVKFSKTSFGIINLGFFKMAASHSTMFDILVKVGLGEHYGVFLEQKITPDIVCCLVAS